MKLLQESGGLSFKSSQPPDNLLLPGPLKKSILPESSYHTPSFGYLTLGIGSQNQISNLASPALALAKSRDAGRQRLVPFLMCPVFSLRRKDCISGSGSSDSQGLAADISHCARWPITQGILDGLGAAGSWFGYLVKCTELHATGKEAGSHTGGTRVSHRASS